MSWLMWFAIQLDQTAVTSVLVQSASLSPPEYKVHRTDTVWIIKERFLVIPANVLHWERYFSRKGTEFPLVFQLKWSSRMSANYLCTFWSGLAACLQRNKILSTRNWKKTDNVTRNKWPFDNSLSLGKWTGIYPLSSSISSPPLLCFNYQQNLLNTHSVGK